MRRFGAGLLGVPSRAEEPVGLDTAAIDALFVKHAGDEEWMDMEGIAKLVGELDMDPETDVRVLVLAWKLKSEEKPGEIKKSEFRAGMQDMRCESVEELKTRALPSLDLGFMEHKEFREFYRFCFKFNREDVQKKTIEKELVIQLLPIVLGPRSPFTNQFTAFLAQAPIARVSADEWNSFLEFSKEFSSGSLDSWEDDGAWPSLLDDFVDFARK